MNGHKRHSLYLDNLVRHLDTIGLKREDIEFLLKEPMWFKQHSIKQNSLCDLIIGYENGKCSALELKGSTDKRPKALNQLQQGRLFIQRELGRDYDCGIFVVYQHPHIYNTEIYDENNKKIRSNY